MQIVVANPRGFCAGVERAILIVERALLEFGAPVYVRHEIVHNRYVVDTLRAQGAVFVETLAAIPAGAGTPSYRCEARYGYAWVALAEPLLLLLMAAIVGTIVVGMLMPIFDLWSAIS